MESSICAPSDQGQKEAFLNGLSQFLSDKGRYICKEPKLAGRVIDLHDLYNRVTSIGGYQRVTDRGLWEEFLDQYGFPAVSVTLAYGLQKIYQTYLEEYEKVHHFGDDETTPFSRSYVGYRRFRYPISDLQRAQNNMNMEKPLVSDYDRVVLSLESCLPNEIDFAVNACTLLSGESRHVLRLPQCRRIVDALLLHAGIVSDGCDSYKEVLKELQNKTHHNFERFWSTSIAKKSVLHVLLPPTNDEDKRLAADDKTERLMDVGSVENREQVEERSEKEATFAEKLQRRLLAIQHKMPDGQRRESNRSSTASSKWADLFHGHRLLGVQDYEGQRILQIALVLLNLSFEDFNVVLLARHPSLVRFVFLCIHSRYSCLRQTGLDILSNISSHIQLLDLRYDVAAMLFDTVHTALLSEDKFERIRGFEVLGNICRKHLNADHVCVAVNDDTYEAMVRNLMVHDVELLLSAIEALYRLSKLGETTCTKIIFVRGCIDILICLVTLNVRTFGPEKLSEIRLARRIAPGMQQPNVQQHAYAVPGQVPTMHPSMGVFPRPMHYQHPKLGSVHQARPTFAHAAPSPHTMPSTPTMKPPLPPQPVRPPPPPPQASTLSPKVQANPPTQAGVQPAPASVVSPNVLPVKPPPVSGTQAPVPQSTAQLPPTIASPPPTSTTSNNMKSPPGAGAIYTHPEMGTIPPVYHYMPAPPQDIEQDSSPESFTKLWIWATYEFEMESYIPRVEVYCEYLASSNRYGRQGKTEVLSATDFGKCLKAIFPQASSRLFNQGRGQPQYHIAGIKKRATPFPVPGYQLKDPESVFSEYQKIPVPRPASAVTVQSNCEVNTVAKSAANAQVVPATADSVTVSATINSVPIQQLQFQPVLVMPIMSAQPVANTTPNTQTSMPHVSNATVQTTPTPTSSLTSVPNSTPTSSTTQTESSAPDATRHVAATSNDSTVQAAPSKDVTAVDSTANSTSDNKASETVASVASTPSADSAVVAEGDSLEKDSLGSEEDASSKGGEAVDSQARSHSEAVNADRMNSSVPAGTSLNCNVSEDCDHSKNVVAKEVKPLPENHKKDGENGNRFHDSDSNHMRSSDTAQLNGFQEEEGKEIERICPKSKSPETNPIEPMLMETDEIDDSATKKSAKSKQTPGKNQELNCEPVLNGYDANEDANAANEQSNGINGKITHAAASDNELVNGEPDACAGKTGLETTTLPVCTAPSTPAQCRNAASTVSVPIAAVTPINSLPHSALNQRLKDTITRRKNSQLYTPGGSTSAGNTTPVNAGLPPSLIQQYSYKPQSKPATTEEARETTSLAQQIIPVNSSGIPQQYAFHAQPSGLQHKQHITTTLPQPSHGVHATSPIYAAQVANKRPNPVTPASAPPAKVLRSGRQAAPTHPIPPPVATRPPYIPVRPQSTPVMVQQQIPTHRPSPGPGIRPGNPHHQQPLPQGGPKAKPPTIDLMAPNASLLVLYRNVGKIPFANDLDEKEDAISKSIRLTACLILTNVARYSDLGRSMLQRHEGHLASVAMSQMDCSPIVSRLLSELQL